MEIRDIIEADKHVTDYGEWGIGEIPKHQFPLRKKKLKLSSDWAWRIIKFDALDNEFIVLLRLNTNIQQYYSTLGHLREDGMAVICSHELHVTHKNWHCHFVDGDVTRTETGYLRDKNNTIYWPRGGSDTPCTIEFDINKYKAIAIASERFRFDMPPEGVQGEFEV